MNKIKTFKLVMLPTTKTSNLIINGSHQYLYALSKEKIRLGEWALNPFDPTGNIVICNESNHLSIQEHWYKIVASDDKTLEIPLIHPSFLPPFSSAFNKGKQISEINLEMEKIKVGEGKFGTLWEEVVKLRSDDTVIIHQAKTYTKEDLIEYQKWVSEEVKASKYAKGKYFILSSDDEETLGLSPEEVLNFYFENKLIK